ncbi:hypothetical protein D8I24_1175 [Cupriavidus necator H850]|nr:hypothetical protein D8I24_1175 [Cupriavidus necator H850]
MSARRRSAGSAGRTGPPPRSWKIRYGARGPRGLCVASLDGSTVQFCVRAVAPARR